MPGFERGDIIRVPFPYTDQRTQQNRPALVISDGPVGDGGRLLWVAMITSAENRGWADDILLDDHQATGLTAPSIVRPAKIATIEAGRALPLGRLPPDQASQVMAAIARLLGLTPPPAQAAGRSGRRSAPAGRGARTG